MIVGALLFGAGMLVGSGILNQTPHGRRFSTEEALRSPEDQQWYDLCLANLGSKVRCDAAMRARNRLPQ
jgi:hypothetical protein